MSKSFQTAAQEYISANFEDFPGELIEVGKDAIKVTALDLIGMVRRAFIAGFGEGEQSFYKNLSQDRLKYWIEAGMETPEDWDHVLLKVRGRDQYFVGWWDPENKKWGIHHPGFGVPKLNEDHVSHWHKLPWFQSHNGVIEPVAQVKPCTVAGPSSKDVFPLVMKTSDQILEDISCENNREAFVAYHGKPGAIDSDAIRYMLDCPEERIRKEK